MIFRKIAVLLLLSILLSCHGSKNDYSVRYQFTGISLENATNLGDFPEVTSEDSILAAVYAIRVNLQHVIISEGTAYADYDHPVENLNPVDSMIITSNSDFNANYPSGASLNDLFVYFNDDYFHVYPMDQLYISNDWKEDYKDNPVTDKMDLLLMYPPDVSSLHIFTVQMFLRDSTVFVASTPDIKLY